MKRLAVVILSVSLLGLSQASLAAKAKEDAQHAHG